MDIHLTHLLNLPDILVETCSYLENSVCFQIGYLAEGTSCPHCNNYTEELHQVRLILVKDLSAFGKDVYLKVPRRQFYCDQCQRYSTERLECIDFNRRHTRRYEMAVYNQVQHSSIEQVGRDEHISSDEVRGIFNHVAQRLKKNLGVR